MYPSLERILKLRKDLDKAFQSACDKAKHSLPHIPSYVEGDEGSQNLMPQLQPPPAKHHCDTSICEETSPAVSVSIIVA